VNRNAEIGIPKIKNGILLPNLVFVLSLRFPNRGIKVTAIILSIVMTAFIQN
jgi:hypothetical protein